MNLLLNELLLALIVVLFTASMWVMLGRVGKLMMQEIADSLGREHTVDFNYCDDMPIEYTLGPITILMCIVTYCVIRGYQISEWQHKRFKSAEKLKKISDQWDR